jgi:hypothetical protein
MTLLARQTELLRGLLTGYNAYPLKQQIRLLI